MATKQRTLVIGDLHGCIEELDEMLKMVSFVPGKDRLITVGDFVDRGPDSLGCVRRLRELKAEGVMGNHEQKHLLYLFNLNKKKHDPTYEMPKIERYEEEHRKLALSFTQEDVDYIQSLPLTYKVNIRTVVVHAGLETNKPIEKQGSQVLRCSWLRKDGSMAKESEFRNTHYWTDSYKGPYNIVYGHKTHNFFSPRLTEVVKGSVYCLGLDTGCVWGGHLSGLWMPSNELVQVRAKREYKMKTARPLPLFGVKKQQTFFDVENDK